MSNAEVEELRTQFVTQWEKTPDHQKMFFMSELNKIRESSFRRKFLMENKEPYKLDYNFEKEKYAKNNKNAPKWFLGILFAWALVDFFKISKLDDQLVIIFGLLIVVLFLITMTIDYINIKSMEVKILVIDNEIDKLHKNQFIVQIKDDLYEEMGEQDFDFYGLINDLDFQRLKLYLLSTVRNSSVFE